MFKFLLSLFFITLTHNCERKLSSPTCQFSVTPKDANCTALTLTQCSWQHCVAFAMIGRVYTCVLYQTQKKYTWGDCMDQCCPNSGPQTYDTLHQCIDEVNKKMMIIWIIVGSILGFMVLILIVIGIIMTCKRKIEEHGSFWNYIRSCCKKRRQVEPLPEAAPPAIAIHRAAAQTELIVLDKWQRSDEKFISQDESCSICLSNQPNIQLQCKHLYHYKCIFDWIQRKRNCPMCLKQIKKFSLHCSKCWKKQKSLIVKQMKDKIIQENPTCGSCSIQQN